MKYKRSPCVGISRGVGMKYITSPKSVTPEVHVFTFMFIYLTTITNIRLSEETYSKYTK